MLDRACGTAQLGRRACGEGAVDVANFAEGEPVFGLAFDREYVSRPGVESLYSVAGYVVGSEPTTLAYMSGSEGRLDSEKRRHL